MSRARADHLAIASRVPQGARVLDVGCDDGALLVLLRQTRNARASGLELSPTAAGLAIARGLSVMQGDADTDLSAWPDDSFDVAILSKTIQEMRDPAGILRELIRIAPHIIISFRNYGYWRRRLRLLIDGRMPAARGESWHEAAALHPCTLTDMVELVQGLGLVDLAAAPATREAAGPFRTSGLARLNWTAAEAVLHARRKSAGAP
jgi:methionine biosynthesis protein MetW